MKATRHNGRSGKHGTYDAKHNDRRFDVENSEHIDAERTKFKVYLFCYLSLVGESWKGEVRMQEEKTAENKANYIDGGNFKARIGNTTYLVGVFFNKAKKVTIEDRMKNLICEEVVAGNF